MQNLTSIKKAGVSICIHSLTFRFSDLLRPRNTEAVAQKCSVKKVFLKILQNSQENTCARVSFLIKLQASSTLLKGESGTGVFL